MPIFRLQLIRNDATEGLAIREHFKRLAYYSVISA